MAAPVIKIKRSSVPGKIPTTASLPLGELALNTNDGKIYIQQDSVGIGSTVIVVNPWSVGLGSNTYNTFFTVGSVGIGTTIPTSSLHVVGDVRVSGIVTASSFVGNVSIAISTSQPSSPAAGTLWYNSNLGRTFIYYNDGDSSQWVDAAPFNVGIIDTLSISGNGYVLGNLGIGTTNPTSKLHVVGNTLVTGIITATTFVGALTGTATSTTNIPNLTGAITSNNTTTSLGSFTSANLAAALTDETGSGANVFATSPTLVTPALGTPSSGTLTSCTGLPLTTGVTGTLPVANGGTGITALGTGVATFLATPSSANLISAVTDETGTGALVFATSPTLVTPALGTPSSGTLTSCTGLPITGITSSTTIGLGVGSIELGHATDTTITRVSAGLVAIEGVNVVTVSATQTLTNKTLTSPTLTTPALGTPASGTLTSCTGLPLTTGVTGTLPVANGGTGVTTSTGTGSVVLSTSPTLVTPLLGTPTSGNLANCTFPTLNQNTSGSAATLTTGRTIAITGDLTYTSPSFNGSGNVTAAGTLATVNSNVGTFGSGGAIPTITVNAKGLITGVTTTAVTSGTTITDDTSTNASRFLTFTSATSGSISAANVSSTKLTFNPSSGNLGIGTTNPTSKLHVIGDVRVSGVVTATDFNSTSDISLKDNIQTIINPLDKIIKLNGVTFNWKENQKPSIGVIAQELQEILPELVTQGDIKSVNYNGLIGVLIEAVKEQQKQIEELRAIVKNQ